MELPRAIVALLFYQAEPISVKRLSTLLKRSDGDIREAILTLPEQLTGVGLCLVQNGDELTIGTAPEASALIEAITKEELSRDISKAGLETLAIVLYKGPITRSEIDYIRGVNSTFILRNLLVRGLVEKVDNPKDQRSFLYKPTFQLLEFMGVTNTSELPEYHDTISKLGIFLSEKPSEADVKEPVAVPSANSNAIEDVTGVAFENEAEEESELDADILEEDLAGENFADADMIAHTEADRNREDL